MNNEKFIVKVQRSLMTSDGGDTILIYDEDDNVSAEFEATDEILKLLDGRMKCFFFATLDKDGGLVLGDVAPWQQW